MSLRIKIFSTTQNNISSLEDQVNAWISVNEAIIKDIKVAFSDNNILMTLLYDNFGTSGQTLYQGSTSSQPPIEIAKSNTNQNPNFQEMLSVFTSAKEEQAKNVKPVGQSDVPTNNVIGAMQDITNPSLKPGRLIQNNYSKYSKGTQKISEDQAFNWD